jgi:hypothetical protein
MKRKLPSQFSEYNQSGGLRNQPIENMEVRLWDKGTQLRKDVKNEG